LRLVALIAVIIVGASGCDTEESIVSPKPTEDCSPPLSGTIRMSPDLLTESDPTTFEELEHTGQDTVRVFDRREDDWITINAFLFDVEFDDGLDYEAQVNPEFGNADTAQKVVENYSEVIGRLPTVLRSRVETIVIHRGDQAFGGNYSTQNLLIHTGRGANHLDEGILGEVFIHEAVHASLDGKHATAEGWLEAQAADKCFITDYGQENPDREDLATSFGPWMAVRYREDRISEDLANTIRTTIPNRLEYLDAQDFDMYPVGSEP